MGWPDRTADLEKILSHDVLVTGYDIITFWVSRMIFSALEHTGQIPFSTVFIHGLVRDAEGRKMSKSLGNGIDPIEIIEKFGSDALRFALATGNSPGNDMRFSDDKIEAARNFANKLWNASRFVRMNLTIDKVTLPDSSELSPEDKWILHRYNIMVGNVNSALDRFELGIALFSLYDFIWDVFCDWYIELSKARLADKDSPTNLTAQRVLAYVLTGTLKLLHPFMPFITEEIYLSLPHGGDTESIMVSEYPSPDSSLSFPEEAGRTERVIAAIKAIRARRNEMNVPPSRKSKVHIATKYPDSFGGHTAVFFERLASASGVEVAESFEGSLRAEDCAQIITDSATIYLPMSDLIDTGRERARLESELQRLKAEIDRINNKLSNPSFVTKAPAAVVEGERAKLDRCIENLEAPWPHLRN